MVAKDTLREGIIICRTTFSKVNSAKTSVIMALPHGRLGGFTTLARPEQLPTPHVPGFTIVLFVSSLNVPPVATMR